MMVVAQLLKRMMSIAQPQFGIAQLLKRSCLSPVPEADKVAQHDEEPGDRQGSTSFDDQAELHDAFAYFSFGEVAVAKYELTGYSVARVACACAG